MKVCANVLPAVYCPVAFPFDIQLLLLGGTEGLYSTFMTSPKLPYLQVMMELLMSWLLLPVRGKTV